MRNKMLFGNRCFDLPNSSKAPAFISKLWAPLQNDISAPILVVI
jgi:hypothetical protein